MKVIYKDVYLIDILKKGRFYFVFYLFGLKKFFKDKDNFYFE